MPCTCTRKTTTPTNFQAVAASATQINLSWDPVNGATKYNLFYATMNSTGTTKIEEDIMGTSYSHTGLTPNFTYRYTLVACNDVGCSEASGEKSATTNDVTFTITELRNTKRDIRPFYANSISVDVSLKDYYLSLKEKGQTKPTADEIKRGLHYKRNLSTTPINIMAWGAVGTIFTATSVASDVKAMLLTSNKTYTLYGMKNNGTDNDVVTLKDFKTDAESTSISAGLKANGHFYDSTAYIYPSLPNTTPATKFPPNMKYITVRAGEKFVIQSLLTAKAVGNTTLSNAISEIDYTLCISAPTGRCSVTSEGKYNFSFVYANEIQNMFTTINGFSTDDAFIWKIQREVSGFIGFVLEK